MKLDAHKSLTRHLILQWINNGTGGTDVSFAETPSLDARADRLACARSATFSSEARLLFLLITPRSPAKDL
jgi:hypothetical protein